MKNIDISYHEIGDVFDYEGTKLKVVPLPNSYEDLDCTGCLFKGFGSACNAANCSKHSRADGRSVIYQETTKKTDMKSTKAELKFQIAEKLNNLKDELFQIVENLEPIIEIRKEYDTHEMMKCIVENCHKVFASNRLKYSVGHRDGVLCFFDHGRYVSAAVIDTDFLLSKWYEVEE